MKSYISKGYIILDGVAEAAISYANNLFSCEGTEAERWCAAYGHYMRQNSGCHWFNPKGQLHREDGPALELPNGVCKWFYNGNLLPVSNQKQFEKYLKLKAFW